MVNNDTFDFKLIEQAGAAFTPDPPTNTARVTITPTTAISAPTVLHTVGPASNNIIELVWNPVTDLTFVGYKVYQSNTSGSYGQSVSGLITPATAAATQTPPTQWRTVVSASDTYYFVVTAVDNLGNESAASNEVTVVRTGMTARTVRP